MILVALLATGGATLLGSCAKSRPVEEEADLSGLMTQQADSLIMIESSGGKKKYRFAAMKMESYEYAKERYREFPEGIDVTTYSDSTGAVESTLVADYAIEFIERELWEAKGNVVAINAEGQKLETQQLFWNRRTKKIYSNIDSRISKGDDVMVGVGFESDEEFRNWEFRKPRAKVMVDSEALENDGSKGGGGSSPGSGNCSSGSGTPQSGGAATGGHVPAGNTSRPTTVTPRQPIRLNDGAMEQRFRQQNPPNGQDGTTVRESSRSELIQVEKLQMEKLDSQPVPAKE